MSATTEVVVIGAGPYGLAVSAHLRELGLDHFVVGRTVDTWRAHMPVGMCLKSEPYGSVIAAPRDGYDIAAYSKANGLDYVDRLGPLPLERFLGYADWFAGQLVPDVRDHTVTAVSGTNSGFRVTFADAESLSTRQVVIATGVLPYARIPDEVSHLPSDLVTHTSAHHRLDQFAGRRVAVIGSGQSALETAALLHEQGAEVHIVARAQALSWVDPNPAYVSQLGKIRRPVTQLCEGWKCAFWNMPAAFRLLPQDMKLSKARTVLGPSGSWWLRDRVEGVIEVLTSQRIAKAVPEGSGVRMFLDGRTRPTLDVDHVICGTGFPIDIARLRFLPEALRTAITTRNGYPMVSRAGESSIPGLYFAGAPAAGSLGPSERFIAGTHNAAAPLARAIARRARAGRENPGTGAAAGEFRAAGTAVG